jgi:Inner membrane component of T3SS, cytoplasmic domain
MMWVEVLSRHHDVLARHRVSNESSTIRIGRAYDNDVILDDPHVAPHHLTLMLDENHCWVAADAGSINGLYVDADKHQRRRVTSAVLSDDRVIAIGHTLLRVRTSDYAVAPERAMLAQNRITGSRAWSLAFAVLAVLLIVSALQSWLGETGEPKPSRHLFAVLPPLVFLAIWAGSWALVSHQFSGFARFERHLLIASAGMLALTLLEVLVSAGAFSFSSVSLLEWNFVAAWLIFAVIIFYHLREVGPKRMRLKAITVAVLAALAIGAQWLNKSDQANNFGQVQYVRGLKPPSMRLVPARTDAEFLSGAEKLKVKLDRARTEEKLTGGGSAYDFDD